MKLSLRVHPPALFPTAQLLLVYAFSYAFGVMAGWSTMLLGKPEDLAQLVGDLSILGVFVLLMLKLSQRSLPQLWRATAPRRPVQGTHFQWLLLILPLAIMARAGSTGVAALLAMPFQPDIVASTYRELIAANQEPVSWSAILATNLYLMVGAVREEIVYRRVIQWHLTLRYGEFLGLVLAALWFAVPHLNPATAVAAAALCAIYLASGRIWVAVAVHLIGNALVSTGPVPLQRLSQSAFAALIVVSAVALVVFVVWAVVGARRRAPVFAAAAIRISAQTPAIGQ